MLKNSKKPPKNSEIHGKTHEKHKNPPLFSRRIFPNHTLNFHYLFLDKNLGESRAFIILIVFL